MEKSLTTYWSILANPGALLRRGVWGVRRVRGGDEGSDGIGMRGKKGSDGMPGLVGRWIGSGQSRVRKVIYHTILSRERDKPTDFYASRNRC